MNKTLLMAAILILMGGATQSAVAGEVVADLCALLPAAEVSKTLGETYTASDPTEAPRPYPNTNTGTDCNYLSKNGRRLWFRVYDDPSPAASAELFSRLSKYYAQYYGPLTPVTGVGDEAYFDTQHALHARKGKVRFYINLSPIKTFTPAVEKQIRDLAIGVAGRL